jgi:hypothetical protein
MCIPLGGIDLSRPSSAGSATVSEPRWPDAPKGNAARVELHRRTTAPNGVEGIIATQSIDPAALSGGAQGIHLAVPSDAPPSFDGAGLEIDYIVRVLVDRRFRPDTAIERPVGIY